MIVHLTSELLLSLLVNYNFIILYISLHLQNIYEKNLEILRIPVPP